ncbi:hypothetical protein BDV11DRAFT_176503 [Aspergillus similis]
MYVVIGGDDVAFVKGRYNEGGMVDGATAEFYGDKTVFSIDGDIITGKISGSDVTVQVHEVNRAHGE